ncbi:MAG TPA: hypothetical protein VMH35_20245 [Streptosporangiaceae bacterium]|nr:hypothetical protein [Streptosporangiaceae bacterium]
MKEMPSRAGRALITAAAGSLAATTLTGAAAVAATHVTALPCAASMSSSHPRDYTTVKVNVHTAAFAGVTTVAHYRTTSTKHHGTAGHRGNVSISYYISGATPGYRVKVSVSVVKGTRHASCSTSFTPHA